MRIVFFGLNEFGEGCLLRLLEERYDIVSVIVPKEQRTKKIFDICAKYKINLYKFTSNIGQLRKKVFKTNPDLIIIASFSKILPKEIINYPRCGAINIHPSELPKYRGAHPIQWAIIKGEPYIGITIHYVNETIDSGDILAQERVVLSNQDNINTIWKKVIKKGVDLLIRVVKKINKSKKRLAGLKQKNNQVTFAPKRTPKDSRIIWSGNVREIFNLVRALKPPYQAFGYNSKGEKIEFIESYIPKDYGQVLAKLKDYYIIAASDGVILLKTDKKLQVGERLK